MASATTTTPLLLPNKTMSKKKKQINNYAAWIYKSEWLWNSTQSRNKCVHDNGNVCAPEMCLCPCFESQPPMLIHFNFSQFHFQNTRHLMSIFPLEEDKNLASSTAVVIRLFFWFWIVVKNTLWNVRFQVESKLSPFMCSNCWNGMKVASFLLMARKRCVDKDDATRVDAFEEHSFHVKHNEKPWFIQIIHHFTKRKLLKSGE